MINDKVKKHKYSYNGSVVGCPYDNSIVSQVEYYARHWKGETMATSKEKALSNLKYRFRIENGLNFNTKLDLPGVIKEEY